LLNQFYVGTLAAMSLLLADNGRQTVIRPFVYVEGGTSSNHPDQRLPVIARCPVCGVVDQSARDEAAHRRTCRENPHLKRSMSGARQRPPRTC
jgi:tRNA 2-thiocytidine biosynthesis protein TtcA